MGKGIEQISLQDIQTAKKHMERDLTSSAIREMHTKTTMRHHFTPTRMVVFSKKQTDKKQQQQKITSVGKDVEKLTLMHC